MPKVVKSAGREMILKVKEFCEAEHKNHGVLIPINNFRKRVAAMSVTLQKDSSSGMEQLLGLNTLLVHQKDTRFVGNKYVVSSPSEVLFYAKEDAGFLGVTRGKNRSFYIDIYDTQDKLSPFKNFKLKMEQLVGLNTLHVRQKHTVFVGNKYVVCSPSGEVLFYAKEDAGFFSVARGKNRPFHIDIYDTQNKLVIGLRRPYTFGPDKMDVTVNGSLASVVRQERTLMKPVLNINDANDRRVLRVKGPAMALQGDSDYEIFTSNKTRIGCIQKQWSGFMREAFTDADNFRLTFPKDLDVRFKAAIIGTSFLIDFLYYEN